MHIHYPNENIISIQKEFKKCSTKKFLIFKRVAFLST